MKSDGTLVKSNSTLVKSKGTLAIVQAIYDYVHFALWATLVAFVLFFLAYTVPRLREAAVGAEALRSQEISQENEDYCCISDLQELRWKAQNRLADRLDF